MKKETATITGEEMGVGGALEYLKRRELEIRNESDRVSKEITKLRIQRDKRDPKDDGTDWKILLSGLESDAEYYDKLHEKYRNDLLKFEKGVVPEKRASGTAIQQMEGERLLEMAATHFRLGVESLKLTVAQNWPLCHDPVEGYKLLCNSLTPMMETAFDNALQEQSLPAWVAVSVKAGL